MKKLKRFSIFILVGILLFSLFFPACGKDNQSGNTDSSNTATDSPNGSYTPYQPTHDRYKDDIVNVLIKPEYSEVNKPWREEDFQLKGIGIEKIVDIRYKENPSDYSASPNFSQLLELTLSEPSKENVIAAIHQIEVLYFVEWAIPEYIYDAEDCYTPNDERYDNQWGLNGLHNISIENEK